MLAFLCSITVSAQRNKVEAKAKSYAEKYERVGNELTISIVVDKISMSRKEIYSAFPDLLDKQFKIREDDIEERDPLGNSGSIRAYDQGGIPVFVLVNPEGIIEKIQLGYHDGLLHILTENIN